MAAWTHPAYRVQERRFTLGRQYRILDPTGAMLAYAKARWFRVKEAFTMYVDEKQEAVAFEVQATKVFDFNANLEVRDVSGAVLGTLRRKGWASIVADRWQVLDAQGRLVGELQEDKGRGLARRMLTRLVPYRARLHAQEGTIATVQGRLQVWGDTYDVSVERQAVDGRVLTALVVVVDSLSAERGSILDVTGLGS
jgi:uncharacterized protein YxjI